MQATRRQITARIELPGVIQASSMKDPHRCAHETSADRHLTAHIVGPYTFLGITIDEHLDWKFHIDNLSDKIARNVGVLNKLKHFLPVYIMKTLYSSLIALHLQYCTLLWANSHVTNIRKLQLLQMKAIRIITSSHNIVHTDPLFSTTTLLKLDDLYKYQFGIFMHKVTHCQLPQNMSSMFLRTDNIHSHQLRNQNSYYIQQIRTNTRKSTINFSGPKC